MNQTETPMSMARQQEREGPTWERKEWHFETWGSGQLKLQQLGALALNRKVPLKERECYSVHF